MIKSRASAETFDGILRSTFAIRLYVALSIRGPPSALERPGTESGNEARHTVVSGHFLEWGRTNNELIRKHAKRPIIDLLVVVTTLNHLGREVVERAAECGPPVAGRVYAPAKIADLELAVDA